MIWRDFFTPKRVLLVLIILAIIGFVALFSRQLISALLPFVIGLFLATLLEPLVDFLERRVRLPRAAAVMTTLISTVTVASYLTFSVITKMIAELIDLANLLPQYRETIVVATNNLFHQVEKLNESLPPIVSLNIQQSLETFFRSFEIGTKDLINRVLATFAGLPVFSVITMVAIVSAFFMSKDKKLLADSFMQIIPDDWKTKVDNTKRRIAVDLIGFIKARLFLLVIVTAMAGAGLVLLNTRYWMLIALVIGILDNIPVVGPGIIFTPWVAMSIILGDTDRAVYLTILYLIIFAARQLIEPKIMGDSVGIHPLAMLLAMYSGIVFFGVIGFLVGPILVIIIKAAIHAGLFKPNLPE